MTRIKYFPFFNFIVNIFSGCNRHVFPASNFPYVREKKPSFSTQRSGLKSVARKNEIFQSETLKGEGKSEKFSFVKLPPFGM